MIQVKNAHRVDLTANLKGLTIHCKEESPDMYASIDAAATALQSKLRKYRTRRNEGYHAGNSMGDDLMAAIEQLESDLDAELETDEFIDPEEPNVMKVMARARVVCLLLMLSLGQLCASRFLS